MKGRVKKSVIKPVKNVPSPFRGEGQDGGALLPMRTIREDGLRWVRAGATSLEEVLRVTRE